jgi:hypothetical protein
MEVGDESWFDYLSLLFLRNIIEKKEMDTP